MEHVLDLRAGELVEVRSAAEIRATLDERGELDSQPFMPEMLQYCGQQFKVYRRADKTCDTIANYVGRRMHHTVHLAGLRCDGSGHDGCQAGCLIFWKEAWLKRVDAASRQPSLVQIQTTGRAAASEPDPVDALAAELAAQSRDVDEQGIRYRCQATEMLRASEPIEWWDPRQYFREILTHNLTAAQFVRGVFYATYAMARRKITRTNYPSRYGTLTKTPSEQLDLQPGELVQVRSRQEIYETLDTRSRNRGLYYDVEMWKFSGGTYRVLRRVDHIVNEKDGRMIKLPNGCVILDGVVCSGERSKNRLFCSRSIYSYWREIWLRRVDARPHGAAAIGQPLDAALARTDRPSD
jgi:hypothetical protein